MQQTISVSRRMPLPVASVWHALAAIGGLEKWFSIIDACHVTGQGVGATRELVLNNGEIMFDRITECNPQLLRVSYQRERLPFPVADYVGWVQVLPDDDHAEVCWQVSFQVEPALQEQMQELIRSALSDGVAGLERDLLQGATCASSC